MKRDPVRTALQALSEAAGRSNHVVGRAARAAREADLEALIPQLVAAFPRFLEDPVRH